MKTKNLYAFIAAVATSFLMVLMLFFPYASATDDYEERLMENADEYLEEDIEFTCEDGVKISLIEYVKLYKHYASEGIREETLIASIVIIAVFGFFSVLAFVMSFLKKPIAIIVFDALALASFKLINYDFDDRGVIGNKRYDWGVASWLTYVWGVLLIIAAILLFVEKRKAKKHQAVEE